MSYGSPSWELVDCIKQEGINNTFKIDQVLFCDSCDYVFLGSESFRNRFDEIRCPDCNAPEEHLVESCEQDIEELIQTDWKDLLEHG